MPPPAAVDLWLLEGFADYVALRDVDLPAEHHRRTRERQRASRRRARSRCRAPRSSTPRATDLEAAYELAWLACVEVADQVGERGLVRVYDEATQGSTTAAALASVGLTLDGRAPRLAAQAEGARRRDRSPMCTRRDPGRGDRVRPRCAATWVPWHPVPGGAPGAVRPDSVFTAEQIGVARTTRAWARRWSLLSLVISLAVASVLGFSGGARA